MSGAVCVKSCLCKELSVLRADCIRSCLCQELSVSGDLRKAVSPISGPIWHSS